LNPQPVPVPDLLRGLLAAVGPSGHEGPAAAVWRDAAAAFAAVTSDSLGTSYARVGAGGEAPALALVAHIDEIGLQVTHIDDGGLLAFTALGGVSPEILAGQRVLIAGRGGLVPGLVARRERRGGRRGDAPRLEHTDLHIDLGAGSRAAAAELVRPGDAGVWEAPPRELPGGRLASRALDNRLGAYAALEAARRIAAGGGAPLDVVAVATVQEETGHAGARAAAFALAPRVALALDVTWATDVPGGDPRRAGEVELGSGAAITRGPVVHPRVVELLVEAAEAEGIAHTFEVYSGATHTDADDVHAARGGVPSGIVSVPIRYMHTPCELVALDDLEAVIALVVAFARRLDRDETFAR
jgi:endoglucanase